MQAEEALEGCLKNSLINKLVESPIPRSCRSGKCILGIDEAGRGPVLGPMSYGLAYFPVDKESLLARLKFADSKALTESTRESLFEAIQSKSEGFEDLGYIIKIISPNMISNSMLRRNKYNLNALSHDTAIDMIKRLLDLGLKASHVYIDTVGPPIKYKEKLQRFFPGINFTVTEKADSKYPIVSAASVCAKVMRDRIVNKWRYVECSSLNLNAYQLGSGYPADPETKNFLERSVDPVFGFPTLARFSWSTITKALEKNACKCDWNEPEDDVQDKKELTKQQSFFKKFFHPTKSTKSSAPTQTFKRPSIAPFNVPTKRTNADVFFQDRSLKRVFDLHDL